MNPGALTGGARAPWTLLDWAGFDCLVETDAPGEMQVRVAFAPAGHSHTNHTSDAPLTVRCPLTVFEQPESMANTWRLIRSVGVTGARVIVMTALRVRALAVDCPVRGKSAAPGRPCAIRPG